MKKPNSVSATNSRGCNDPYGEVFGLSAGSGGPPIPKTATAGLSREVAPPAHCCGDFLEKRLASFDRRLENVSNHLSAGTCIAVEVCAGSDNHYAKAAQTNWRDGLSADTVPAISLLAPLTADDATVAGGSIIFPGIDGENARFDRCRIASSLNCGFDNCIYFE